MTNILYKAQADNRKSGHTVRHNNLKDCLCEFMKLNPRVQKFDVTEYRDGVFSATIDTNGFSSRQFYRSFKSRKEAQDLYLSI